MRFAIGNFAMALSLASIGMFGRMTEEEKKKKQVTRPRAAYNGNKVTLPDSKGVYASNVKDTDFTRVLAAETKRSRKNEKRRQDYRICLLLNQCVSVVTYEKLLTV